MGRRVCVLTCTEQACLNDDKFKSTMLKIIPQYPSRPSEWGMFSLTATICTKNILPEKYLEWKIFCVVFSESVVKLEIRR